MGLLLIVVTITVLTVCFRALYPLYLWRILGLFSTKELSVKFGETVVITGATSGIGEAIALNLAHKQLKLVLLGRDTKKLEDLKQRVISITKKPEKVETILADFSSTNWNEEKFKELETKLKKLDIAVFIHSAGISYPSALNVEELDPSIVEDILSVNLLAAIRLTQAVLPGMKKRRNGALMYIGSAAGMVASEPLYAVYAASKAGLQAFCNAIQTECANHNVVVQYQAPFFVATKLSKIRNASLTVLTTTQYAKDSIQCLEAATPSLAFPVTRIPSAIHSLIMLFINFMPYGLWTRFRLSMTQSVRDRYLKKKV